MGLESLMTRDKEMYYDAVDIALGISDSPRPRVDFMTKYNLSRSTTREYIVHTRRELDKTLGYLNSIGECTAVWPGINQGDIEK